MGQEKPQISLLAFKSTVLEPRGHVQTTTQNAKEFRQLQTSVPIWMQWLEPRGSKNFVIITVFRVKGKSFSLNWIKNEIILLIQSTKTVICPFEAYNF